MSRNKIAKGLAMLTYRDMVDFSEILAAALAERNEAVPPSVLAEILTTLPYDNDQTASTNEILAGFFRRKRQITIQPEGQGVFKIACPSLDGAVVVDKDVREGVSQLLDTVVVLESFADG